MRYWVERSTRIGLRKDELTQIARVSIGRIQIEKIGGYWGWEPARVHGNFTRLIHSEILSLIDSLQISAQICAALDENPDTVVIEI